MPVAGGGLGSYELVLGCEIELLSMIELMLIKLKIKHCSLLLGWYPFIKPNGLVLP